jgi:mannose-1-phosphate guanylyltransferase
MLIDTETISQRTRSARSPEAPAHVLILAGGDGARLRPVTRVLAGDDRPKQLCALVGTETLLTQTERRAALIVPRDQVLLSLTRRHEPWYREHVADRDPFTLVIQPENRGTAAGILYGLLRIATRTKNAPVVVLPSDHWVSNDSAFMLHAQAAVGIVEAHPDAVVLLGVEPTRPEVEFGWIERAGAVIGSWSGLSRGARFIEKPPAEVARRLQAAGGSLWNTAVVVGQLEQLLFLFAMGKPDLVDDFLSIWPALGTPSEAAAVESLYAELPAADVSRDVLAKQPEALSVLTVGGVAWEDLGHPRGILEARRHASAPAPPAGRGQEAVRNARA